MGQLIAVILNIMVLLLVPLGILQVHTVIQTQNELLEVSAAVTKHVSNHGGIQDAVVQQQVQAIVASELAEKQFSLSEQELTIHIIRTKKSDPILWSHEDEFELRMEIPYPRFTNYLPVPKSSMAVTRRGTINVMDYDL